MAGYKLEIILQQTMELSIENLIVKTQLLGGKQEIPRTDIKATCFVVWPDNWAKDTLIWHAVYIARFLFLSWTIVLINNSLSINKVELELVLFLIFRTTNKVWIATFLGPRRYSTCLYVETLFNPHDKEGRDCSKSCWPMITETWLRPAIMNTEIGFVLDKINP